MDLEFKPRIFTPEERRYVKQQLLIVSQILKKWSLKFPNLDRSQIKLAFLNNKSFTNDLDWQIDQKIISDFQTKTVPQLGEPIAQAVLRSFLGMCKKYASKASARVSAQMGIRDSYVYEDLMQDAIQIVLHSMYYYSKGEIKLSTYIGNSLKNGLNRYIRYSYCATSPVSEEDNVIKIQILDCIQSNPSFTFDQIFDFMNINHGLKDEAKIRELLAKMVREDSKAEDKKFLHNLPCYRSVHEDVDCIDTVELLKKALSPEGQKVLGLTPKEIEAFEYGQQSNFERGWQMRYFERLKEDGRPLTKQRISQIYESALKKIRPFLVKACG